MEMEILGSKSGGMITRSHGSVRVL